MYGDWKTPQHAIIDEERSLGLTSCSLDCIGDCTPVFVEEFLLDERVWAYLSRDFFQLMTSAFLALSCAGGGRGV